MLRKAFLANGGWGVEGRHFVVNSHQFLVAHRLAKLNFEGDQDVSLKGGLHQIRVHHPLMESGDEFKQNQVFFVVEFFPEAVVELADGRKEELWTFLVQHCHHHARYSL